MRPFGELEAAIMRELWERDQPATVRDVLASLATSRKLAYNTVLTVMDNLHRKGQLNRQMSGRAWLYRPVRSRAEHAAALLQDVLAESGDQQKVFLHFVADLDPGSVAQLRAAVEGGAQPWWAEPGRSRMIAGVGLLLMGLGILLVGPRLATASWTHQAPGLAVLTWQALTTSLVAAVALAGITFLIPTTALAGGLGAVFHACAVSIRAAYGSSDSLPGAVAGSLLAGALPAWVLLCLTRELEGAWRRRRAVHRSIQLVGQPHPTLGVVVMDAQTPAAFCVPGRTSQIVVTTGALTRLTASELKGVLAHEHAHLRARHNLAVSLSRALARAFPRLPLFQTAAAQIQDLVELLADDAAAAQVDRVSVASAIVSLAEMRAPTAAMAMAQGAASLRVHRLLQPGRPLESWRLRLCSAGVGAVIVLPLVIAGVPALGAALSDLCNI